MEIGLTGKQRQVLEVIRRYIREHGTAPTLEELADSLGVSKATAQGYVRRLVEKGVLRRRRYEHRGIEIVEETDEAAKEWRLAVVGRIAAGRPLEAVEQQEQMELCEILGLERNRRYFVLRVVGDSMVEDGIYDGDLVVCEHTFEARDGDVVVALLPDGTATLKRFYREKDGVRLEPANADMEPLRVPAVMVQGVVRTVIRRFG